MERYVLAESSRGTGLSPGRTHHTTASGYFEQRNKKLQEQAAPTEGRPQIFRGIRLYFNGRTGERSAHYLAKLVQQHGGGAAPNYAVRKVTYVIAENLNGSKTHKVLHAHGRYLVVHPDWITACVQAGRLLAVAPYLVIRGQGHTVPQLVEALEAGRPPGPPVYTHQKLLQTPTPPPPCAGAHKHSGDMAENRKPPAVYTHRALPSLSPPCAGAHKQRGTLAENRKPPPDCGGGAAALENGTASSGGGGGAAGGREGLRGGGGSDGGGGGSGGGGGGAETERDRRERRRRAKSRAVAAALADVRRCAGRALER